MFNLTFTYVFISLITLLYHCYKVMEGIIIHSSPEGNVGKKKGSGEFFSKIIFLVTTDHENSFPKIRADPSWS